MAIRELVFRNRSYRRFHENEKIDIEMLKGLIDLARLSASGANAQALKFYLSNSIKENELIFKTLGWAAHLKDWPGPDEGERPSAYVIILKDTRIKSASDIDHGIAAQSILLGAVEEGYGGCMIATIRKKDLASSLNIQDCFEILLVIALGKPKEKIIIEDIGKDGDTRYWRDPDGTHHVPKRLLKDLIIN